MSTRTLEINEIVNRGGIVGGSEEVPQFRLVKLDNDGKVVLCGEGERAEGVSRTKAGVGEEIRYMELGTAPVSTAVASSFERLDNIMSDSNGRAVKATGSGSYILGHLEEDAKGDNKLCSAWINCKDVTVVGS